MSPVSRMINPSRFASVAGAGPDGTNRYVEITVGAAQVTTGPLLNIPVYVDLSLMPAAFFTNVQADGGDIRVTESDGTSQLALEVVWINTGASTGEIHFKADSCANNDVYRIYYDQGGGASQPAAGATYGSENVWNANYVGVWHLNEASGQTRNDSTSKANHLTDTPTVGTGTGVIGSVAADFDGSTDYLSITNAAQTGLDFLGDYTIQAWINPDDAAALAWFIYRTNQSTQGFDMFLSNGTHATRYMDAGGISQVNATTGTVPTATWTLLTTSVDVSGNTVSIYWDTTAKGESVISSNASSIALNTGVFYLGGPTSFGLNGLMDEVRIQTIADTNNVIVTLARNLTANGTFFSFGTEQSA